MKRLFSIIIVAVMFIGFSIEVSAAVNDDFSFKQRTVRVGISQFPHFSEIDNDGSYSGIIIDYITEIKKYTGWNIEYVVADPSEVTKMIDNGKIDLIGAMIKNDQTVKFYDFAELNSGYAYSTITVNKNHTNYIPNDYDTFKGIKVGVYNKAISRITAFDRFRLANGLDIIPIYFDDPDKWEEAFVTGEVDAQLTSSAKLRDGEKIIAKFQLEPYYFGVAKGNSNILRELNYALEQIRQINPNFDADLYRKHFSSSEYEEFNLTLEEKKFVAQHPVLRVAAVSDWQPISYFDSKGQFKGISADILKIICEKTGFKLEYVSANNLKHALKLLKENKVDMLVGVDADGLGNDGNDITFSLPYIFMQTVVLHKDKNIANFSKNSVIASAYGFEYDIIGSFVKKSYENVKDAIEAVKSEEADFAVISSFAAEHYVLNNEKNDLNLISIPDMDIKLSMAFNNPVNPMLLTIFDRTIYSISDVQRQDVIFQNTSLNGKITIANFIYSNPVQAILIILSASVILFILLFLIMYMRLRVSRKSLLISDTYRIIGELSDEYIFAYDFETKKLSLPDKIAKLMGVNSIVSRDDCTKEGLSYIIDNFNASMAEPNFSIECNCVLADGEEEMFRVIGMIIYGSSGRPVRGIGKLVSIQEEIEEKQRLEKMLNTDSLTGLYSKRYCEQLSEKFIENDKKIDGVALMMIDIDNFKMVNDTLGHLGGDEVLKHFSRILKTVFYSGEIIGRWGGDEFLVFINDTQDRRSVEKKAQKLCSNMNDKFSYGGAIVELSISMGIAFVSEDTDFKEMFQAADAALYHVKRDKKNGYKFA